MARFVGVGNVWNVVREINVSEIKEQAEQPIRVALIGAAASRRAVSDALYEQEQRYGGDYKAIEEYDLPLAPDQAPPLHRCDLAVLIVDSEHTSDADIAAAADQIDAAGVPALALLVDQGQSAIRLSSLRHVPSVVVVRVPDLAIETVVKRVAPALLDRLPEDQRIAAARAIPALRDTLARRLINDTSVSNATYALTSGIPQMVPILNVPLNAADMLVLSKNQVLLIYKLALAFGAPSDFQKQMREVIPVIGSGFLWRQVARQLVGLIPGFGIAPKVAVAYTGTYVVGQAGLLWYRSGEVLSQSDLKQLYRQTMTKGRQRAQELIARRNTEDTSKTTESASDLAVSSGPPPPLWRRLLRRRKKNTQQNNDDL